MLEAKAEKHGRDLRVINRWEATSQKCSCCGEKGGKKELKLVNGLAFFVIQNMTEISMLL